jgi:hypothetical protein
MSNVRSRNFLEHPPTILPGITRDLTVFCSLGPVANADFGLWTLDFGH